MCKLQNINLEGFFLPVDAQTVFSLCQLAELLSFHLVSLHQTWWGYTLCTYNLPSAKTGGLTEDAKGSFDKLKKKKKKKTTTTAANIYLSKIIVLVVFEWRKIWNEGMTQTAACLLRGISDAEPPNGCDVSSGTTSFTVLSVFQRSSVAFLHLRLLLLHQGAPVRV